MQPGFAAIETARMFDPVLDRERSLVLLGRPSMVASG
jgi:hypothetical protein